MPEAARIHPVPWIGVLAAGLAVVAGFALERRVDGLAEERYAAALDSTVALLPLLDDHSLRILESPGADSPGARDRTPEGFFFLLDPRAEFVLPSTQDAGRPTVQLSVARRMIATGSGSLVHADARGSSSWSIYRPFEPGGVAGWTVPLAVKRAPLLRVRAWWIPGVLLVLGLALLAVREAGSERRRGKGSPSTAGLESMREALVVTDTGGRIVFLNRAAAALSTRDGAEAVGRPVDEVLPLRGPDECGECGDRAPRGLSYLIDRVLAADCPPQATHRYNSPGPGKRNFEVTGARAEVGAVLVLRDVTEPTEFQARYRERDRMEAIRSLAAGVGHDFNNLLGGVRGNADLLLLDLPQDTASAELRESAESVLDATERGAKLTAQLLAYSRKLGTSRRIDCHRLVEDVLQIAGRTFGPGIALRRQLAAREFQVLGDEGALESALLQIAVSARDAMAGRGTLTITTSDSTLLPDHAEVRPAIMISLRDDGPGMDEEARRRVFDPVFTTGEQCRRAGPGLAAVYGAIIGHDGEIVVESAPGAGTAIHVRIPLAPQAV